MKKTIFGVFAHPDDEAFGPSGTLLQETQNGAELHLITLTDGGAGTNPDNLDDLGAMRLEEWQRASKLLGAKTMEYFGYTDGRLCNEDMITIGDRLVAHVKNTIAGESDDTIVEFMTLDLNGLTGHIDHIVAARAASFAFFTLKETDSRMHAIRYFCLPRDIFAQNTNWIFAENGRTPEEIDETIDARYLREQIIEVMRQHHSQRADYEYNMELFGDSLGLNHFIVKH